MTPVLLITLAFLMQPADGPVSTAPPPPTAAEIARATPGEPMPPGSPTEPYELTSWCYGALGEYLSIYDRVIPDLRDIDRDYGSSVHNETLPYAQDVAAARVALQRFARAMRAAERASPTPIANRGAAAVQQGRAIWSVAERGSRRALARAWLYWGVPDQCDITALSLNETSTRLATALARNDPAAAAAARAAPGAVALAPLTTPMPRGAAVPTLTGPVLAMASPPVPPARPNRIVDVPVVTAPVVAAPVVTAPVISAPATPLPAATPRLVAPSPVAPQPVVVPPAPPAPAVVLAAASTPSRNRPIDRSQDPVF